MRMNPGGALPGVGVELCLVNRTLPGAACGFGGAKGRLEKCTLSDLGVWRANREKTQCFRVRADVFASAHGRPDGMPGRIIGARESTAGEEGREDFRLWNLGDVATRPK